MAFRGIGVTRCGRLGRLHAVRDAGAGLFLVRCAVRPEFHEVVLPNA